MLTRSRIQRTYDLCTATDSSALQLEYQENITVLHPLFVSFLRLAVALSNVRMFCLLLL
jgi:hypothetical protein